MVHRGMDTDMDGQLVLRFLLTWVQFKNSIWNYIHRNLFIDISVNQLPFSRLLQSKVKPRIQIQYLCNK